MYRILALTALAVGLAASLANAQAPAAAGTAPVNDLLFAEAAAAGGMAEVTLAQIGEQKATDPELKKFSREMVEEHTKLNQELMTLAGQKRVTLPRTLDIRATFCTQALNGLSGEKFDCCYAKAQLNAHMDALGTFEAEAERGQDADIKAFASRALPQIKEHLHKIKPIVKKLEKEDGKDRERRSDKDDGKERNRRSDKSQR